ncbi:unnamed protein product [Camellia sinensis]
MVYFFRFVPPPYLLYRERAREREFLVVHGGSQRSTTVEQQWFSVCVCDGREEDWCELLATMASMGGGEDRWFWRGGAGRSLCKTRDLGRVRTPRED